MTSEQIIDIVCLCIMCPLIPLFLIDILMNALKMLKIHKLEQKWGNKCYLCKKLMHKCDKEKTYENVKNKN